MTTQETVEETRPTTLPVLPQKPSEKTLAVYYEQVGIVPAAVQLAVATDQASNLMQIVEAKKLYTSIGGKKYLYADAWMTILSFNSAHPVTEWTRTIEQDGVTIGYLARVNVMKNGAIVSAAEMECYLDSFPCHGKEGKEKDRAARSTAQTWAASKAAKLKYAWVAVLGGFEPTPAHEIEIETAGSLDELEAQQGLCPVHHVAFVHRVGTGKNGPYDFWTCPQKIADGRYCKEKPSAREPKDTVADQESSKESQQPASTAPTKRTISDEATEFWALLHKAGQSPRGDTVIAKLGMTLIKWIDSGHTGAEAAEKFLGISAKTATP